VTTICPVNPWTEQWNEYVPTVLKVQSPCHGPELALVESTEALPVQTDGTALSKSTSWNPPPDGLLKLTLEPTGTSRSAGALPLESWNA
jgi:hypothetical protein